MKRILLAALLATFSTACLAQSNTEILIAYERKTKLEIYVFDKNRNQVFSNTELNKYRLDGERYWSILIVDDKIAGREFAYFCVRDRRGNWSVPASIGKAPTDLVCHDNPTAAGRGRVIWVPNRQ